MALSTRVSYAGTFTPAANSLLLVIIDVIRNATATPWTPSGVVVSGGGLTWTRVAIATGAGVSGDYADSVQAWVAEVEGSPASMSIALTPTAGDAAYALVTGVCYGWTGYDTTDPIGAILQATNGPTDGLWSPTLDSAPATTSEVISAFSGITGGTGNVNPEAGSGWTPVDRLATTDLYCLETQSRRNSTSDVCAWSDTSGPSATTFLYFGPTSVAVEIKGDGLAPGPEITSADDTTPASGQAVTLVVANAGATQGASTLQWGGVTQTCTAWSDTSITFTANPPATLKNGQSANLVLTVSSVGSAPFALTLNPPVGYSYVNITSLAGTGVLVTSPALQVGWQVEVQDPAVAYADGTWSAPPLLRSFQFRVHDGTSFGALATQTITPSYFPRSPRFFDGTRWVGRRPLVYTGTAWARRHAIPQ